MYVETCYSRNWKRRDVRPNRVLNEWLLLLEGCLNETGMVLLMTSTEQEIDKLKYINLPRLLLPLGH